MKQSAYPDPHDVVLIHKSLRGRSKRRSFQQVQTVLVDGQAICLPRDVDVTVEAGGAGYLVTLTLIASSLSTEAYEYEPQHLQEDS